MSKSKKPLLQLDLFAFTNEPVQKPEPKTIQPSIPKIPEKPIVFENKTFGVRVKQKIEPVVENIVLTKTKRGRKSYKEMDAALDLVQIPEDDVLNKKLYYPIGEVANFFGVKASLIRAWEIEFDILKPRKNRKGDRLFRVEDIKNLQLIYFLLRNRKHSIDGAKQYLKANKKKVDVQHQVAQSLTKLRSFLLELKANLQ